MFENGESDPILNKQRNQYSFFGIVPEYSSIFLVLIIVTGFVGCGSSENSPPQTVEPTAIPQTVEPTAIPQTVEPTAIPQTVEPTAIPQTVKPTAIPQTVKPTLPSVNIPDATLRAEVGIQLGITSGDPIYKDDMATLEGLQLSSAASSLEGLQHAVNLEKLLLSNARGQVSDLSPLSGLDKLEYLSLPNQNIQDITALSDLTELTDLYLNGNNITDLSPLTSLNKLNMLDLRYNKITEISPLVTNSGLNQNDTIDLRDNLLTLSAINTDIAELESRGVTVSFDDFLFTIDREAQIYNDNIFVFPIDASLTADYLDMRSYVISFYEHFEDVFDFILVISNVNRGEDLVRNYAGGFYQTRNKVQGIGQDVHSVSGWGDSENLLALVHLTEHDGISQGPILHELMHQWDNNDIVVDAGTGIGGHWGFSSVFGQLGGFRKQDLVDLGDGRYTAGVFSPLGYSSYSILYSPMELYLAGFLPPEDVPPWLVAKDAVWALDESDNIVITEDGFLVFEATEIITYTIDDLVSDHGERIPNSVDSQKDFRVAVIFLIDSDHPATKERLDSLSNDISWFSNPNDDSDNSKYNFYEATGGRATITMNGLSQYEK